MPASYRFEHTKNDMKYHLIAFIIGMIADLIIGDPHCLPHPIRLIGRFIAFLEKKLNTDDRKKAFRRGVFTAFFVPLVSGLLSAAVIVAAYHVNVIAGVAAEAILTYYIMAIFGNSFHCCLCYPLIRQARRISSYDHRDRRSCSRCISCLKMPVYLPL